MNWIKTKLAARLVIVSAFLAPYLYVLGTSIYSGDYSRLYDVKMVLAVYGVFALVGVGSALISVLGFLFLDAVKFLNSKR